jgi:hypothetical protein
MKYTELLSIPIRVLGIYIFYSAFLAVINQYFILSQVAAANSSDYKIYAIAAILEVGFMLIAALALTRLPLTISNFLTPTRSESTFNTSITSEQLQSAALCVLGIYIITDNIPDLIFNTARLISYLGQPLDPFDGVFELTIKELATITEILIGVFLCVKSDVITLLITRLRAAGIAAPPSN